jgi:hypothetical protein
MDNRDKAHTIPEIADGIKTSRVTVWRAMHDNRAPIERLGIRCTNGTRYTGVKPSDEYYYDEHAAQMAVMKYQAEKAVEQNNKKEVVQEMANIKNNSLNIRVTDISNLPYMLLEETIQGSLNRISPDIFDLRTRFLSGAEKIRMESADDPEMIRMRIIAHGLAMAQLAIDLGNLDSE